jgi:hypothetical protein
LLESWDSTNKIYIFELMSFGSNGLIQSSITADSVITHPFYAWNAPFNGCLLGVGELRLWQWAW